MPNVLIGQPKIEAGRRDKWVEIEQRPSEPEGGGYPVETWTALAGAWMGRKDMRADERYVGAQDTAHVETQWHMPYRSDMDPELVDVAATRRLKYRGRVYNIQAGILLDRKQGIELITIAKAG